MFRQFILFLVLLSLILSAPLSPRIAVAQGSNEISYGQTVTGKITNDAFRSVYTFQGHKGDIVDATLTSTDGALAPVLLLTDAQNAVIAMSDDSSVNNGAAIVSQQLPEDGAYFLIVTRFGQGIGVTTGSFSLSLTHAGVTGNPNEALQYGDSVVGEITADQYQRIYSFHGSRGDIITAKMQRISGDLDSYLILADSVGKVLAFSDDDTESPGSLDAAIRSFRIDSTANYVLVATRFGREAGASHGGFALTLDRLPPESLGAAPEKAILLDYGANVSGTVDSDHIMTFYLIEAKKGDVLTIIATRTRGNLDPILVLNIGNADNLKEVAENDSGTRGQDARISAFTIPADGIYTLLVSRFNRDKGITAGGYSLSVVARHGATPGPGGRLTLSYGGAVSAIINDSNPLQQYLFTASAGDLVTMTMDATSGNLLPVLILLDASGKQVAMDDPGNSSARLPRVKLAAGNYVIVATRRGRDKGTTQGAYALILTLENPR